MKTIYTALIALLAASFAHAAERPNIVFMLSDDQGWGGLSVAMHPDVAASKGEIFHTPNLERLAAQGMRFSAGYAPASVCSPTRISLQTGKSPAQLHWTKAAPAEAGHKMIEPRLIKNIADSESTVAELLRGAGYATAHYGKWHIGGGGPARHGYDESDGDTGNENAYQFVDPNPVDIFGMADRAAAFIEKKQEVREAVLHPAFMEHSSRTGKCDEGHNDKVRKADSRKQLKAGRHGRHHRRPGHGRWQSDGLDRSTRPLRQHLCDLYV